MRDREKVARSRIVITHKLTFADNCIHSVCPKLWRNEKVQNMTLEILEF